MKKFTNHMLHKTADPVGATGKALGGAIAGAGGLLPYAIGVPLVGGAIVGYLASKMTSPSDTDVEAIQQRVLEENVDTQLALSRRKLEAARRRIQGRIQGMKEEQFKRDMFV